MKPRKGITTAQRCAFFRMLSEACRNMGHTSSDEREAYRKAVMFEETGKRHLADLDRTGDFDKVMARFAADADDYEAAGKFAVGDAARLAFLVRVACEQIMQLKGCPAGSTAARDYLAGVIGQAHIHCGTDPHDPAYWLDISPDSLQSVFVMLDTHRRRLLRRLLQSGNDAFLGFDPSVRYEPQPDGHIRLVYFTPQTDQSSSIRVNVRRSQLD